MSLLWALPLPLVTLAAATTREATFVPAVVVVTTYPGEYTWWHNVLPLTEDIPFPAGALGIPLGWNSTLRVLGVVTGMGARNTALSITALGHDPRFDFGQAYWLLAGIAGVDPMRGTIGSAAWAGYIVDGNRARYIDPHEAPTEWPTGWMPMERTEPYGLPSPSPVEQQGMVYELNQALVAWAVSRSQNASLPDTPEQQKARAPYAAAFPLAGARPQVLLGDGLSTDFWWTGAVSAAWARNWTRYWTSDAGNFAMSAMEDAAVITSLVALRAAGRVRGPGEAFLALRTASNFVQPPPSGSASSYDFAVLREVAYESAFNAGLPVVLDLAKMGDKAPVAGLPSPTRLFM